MRDATSYYAKVLYWITAGQNGRFKDTVVERVMADEPDLIDQIDAIRERLKRHFVACAQQQTDTATGVSESLAAVAVENAPDTPLPDADDHEDSLIMADSEEERTADKSPALRPGELPAVHADLPPLPPETRTESLPNGRAGQQYSLCLDDVLVLPEHVTLTLEDDGETGLTLSDERCLHGELHGAGSVQLMVAGRNDEGREVLLLTLRLAVIPSSRDLWKNLPSDPEAPYAKPDEDAARLALDSGWQMAMASLRGRAHAHHGGQRDDHGIIAHTDSGWQLLVVADGAGSCALSREGSRLAATASVEALHEALAPDSAVALEEAVLAYWGSEDRSTRIPQPLVQRLQDTVITAVHKAHLAIHQEAERSEQPIKAFSTTLLVALHKVTEQGHIVISFGIGDGAIVALEPHGNAVLMNSVDSGEHAGQTRFLDGALFQDSAGLYQRLNVQVLESLKALVLATDGITDPKFASDRELQDGAAWNAFFASLTPALLAMPAEDERDPLLEYLNFFIERHHDDRTLAVLFDQPLLAASVAGGEDE